MKKTLCIDFAAGAIRCAEVKYSNNTTSVLSGFSLPGVSVQDDKPSKEIISAFAAKYKACSMRSKEALVYIHSPGILYREVQLPPIRGKDILNFLRLNAKDYFPISVESCIIDVSLLEKRSDGLKLAVFAASKDLISRYRKYLKALGFSTVRFAFFCPSPERISGAFICATALDGELFITRHDGGKVVYSRRENVTGGTYSGAFIRADNYIKSSSGADIFDEPLYVFGEEEYRGECLADVAELFGKAPAPSGDKLFDAYGDISNIWRCAREARGDYLEPFEEGKRNAERGAKVLVVSALVLLLALASSFVFFKVLPEKSLREKKAYLGTIASDAIKYDLYQEYKQLTANGASVSLDTYNNHFEEFIGELKKKLPSTCRIKSIIVSEKNSQIVFTVPTKEDAASAINSLDSLTKADAGDISELRAADDGYLFSVTLNYKTESESGHKHNHNH